jgi:hypothetical protein
LGSQVRTIKAMNMDKIIKKILWVKKKNGLRKISYSCFHDSIPRLWLQAPLGTLVCVLLLKVSILILEHS